MSKKFTKLAIASGLSSGVVSSAIDLAYDEECRNHRIPRRTLAHLTPPYKLEEVGIEQIFYGNTFANADSIVALKHFDSEGIAKHDITAGANREE